MNKPIQLALAALALCAAQQCSAALPLSFPVARDWLYERSDKLKASEEQVQSKRETQKSLEEQMQKSIEYFNNKIFS